MASEYVIMITVPVTEHFSDQARVAQDLAKHLDPMRGAVKDLGGTVTDSVVRRVSRKPKAAQKQADAAG